MKLPTVENYEDALQLIEQTAESESRSKQELVDEFDQFLQTFGYGLFTDSELFAIETAEMLQYAKLFLSSRKWDESFMAHPSRHFHDLMECLLDSETNQVLYDSLSPSAQNYLLRTSTPSNRMNRRWDPDIFIRILSKLESHPTHPLKYDHVSHMMLSYADFDKEKQTQVQSLREQTPVFLREIAKNSPSLDVVSRLDLTDPSDRFLNLMLEDKTSRFLQESTNLVEIVMLWKVYYGEEAVTEVLERFKEISHPLTKHDLMDLLDDWEDLRDYPNEWILETRSKTRD